MKVGFSVLNCSVIFFEKLLGDDILANELDKKRLGWFKSNKQTNLNNEEEVIMELEEEPQSQEDNDHIKEEKVEVVSEKESTPKAALPIESEKGIGLFSRDGQDKIALDVIISVENIIKDRQLLSYKYNALSEKLSEANDTINRYKREQQKKEQIIQEKLKEIRDLEISLTNKQMSYEQLLEDYKEYQISHNLEYDKISNQLETEKAKYNKLYEEAAKIQAENLRKITELENRIRNLEIENQKYVEQYEKIAEEKAQLMKTINDFTERMSFSFSPKPKE